MPTFIDLFCGAGGLSLGLKRAGWTSLLAVDCWSDALRSYAHNFSPEWLARHGEAALIDRGRAAIELDLASPGASDRLVAALGDARPDWVVGGPPCKGFSTVGRRDRDDPRNRLVARFQEAVARLRPEGFLMENVLGLRDMAALDGIAEGFRAHGYAVSPLVLKAADYGVPQLRRRLVLVGLASGRPVAPPPVKAGPQATVWQAIGDLPPLAPGQTVLTYSGWPSTELQRALRGGSDTLQGHQASRHPARLVEAIGHIPDGGNRKDIPPHLQPKSGFHNSYSRLSSAAPAVAITQNMGKPSGTRCIHPTQHRGLSAREGARLQTFPDWFHFMGGVVSQREQIANAVPPTLAEVIGRALGDPAGGK